MLKMVDGTGIIGVDMVCPLGGAVSPPQPPNYDKVEMEGVGSLMLPNSLKAPLERVELLGNSVQGENPSPDNPQEIKSAGRKSKNLFNKNTAKQGYEFPSVANDVETPRERWFVSDFMPVKSGAKYFISGKGTGAGCKMYNKDKVFVKNVQACFGVITIEDNITYFRINGEIKDLDKIQVEEGIVATDYEPYGYLLDVKVTGKNLFDREKARDTANWIIRDGDGYAKFPIRVGKGNKATFSYTEKLTPGKGFYLGIAQSDTGSAVGWLCHSTEINLNNNKLTVVAKGDCLYLSCNKTSIQKFFDTIQTLQVEMGSEPTPYEPYTEQTLTLTSDRPITKWDRLVEQGGQYGWLYGSKIYVVTGNEVFESRDGYNIESYTNRFFILNDLLKENDVLKPLAYMKCLRNVQYVYSPNIFEEGFETNINQFHIKLSNDRVGILASDDHAVRTAKFSGYMKKIHKNGNPIEILYATTDTVFFPLSQEEQTQLRNLHSYNGTTHVFVDSGEIPCGIKLTYRKEI